MKLKVRFALTFALLVGCIHILFSLGVYWISASFRENEFIEKLKDRAVLLTHLASDLPRTNKDPNDFNQKLFNQFASRAHFTLDDEYINIFDWNKNLIFSTHSVKSEYYSVDLFFRLQEDNFVRYKNGNRDGIGVKLSFKGNNYTTFIEAHDIDRLEKLNELRTLLFTSFIGGIILISLLGVFYANQLLKPIHQLITQIRSTSLNNLTTRIEISRTDEIGELANSYNQMIERLEKGVQSQKLFATNISHELRTPLASTKNIIQVALQQPRDNVYYQKLLERILEQTNRIIKLSNGLLDLARTTNDPSSLEMKKIDLIEIIWYAHELLTTSRKEYTVNIHHSEFNDANEIEFIGNEYLLHLMFLNVMENACKFSENKTADVYLTKQGKFVTLEIKDTGIGIAEDELGKILEPAFRGSNTQGIYGHGIGLALVKNIAQLHKISFLVESQKNKGTSVNFKIPVL
ncbi:MAG: HAMP domain-containing protein [Bacteroidia bacterium]|nr:HAMP domain-containing protein [Bacteroidia bacterium]